MAAKGPWVNRKACHMPHVVVVQRMYFLLYPVGDRIFGIECSSRATGTWGFILRLYNTLNKRFWIKSNDMIKIWNASYYCTPHTVCASSKHTCFAQIFFFPFFVISWQQFSSAGATVIKWYPIFFEFRQSSSNRFRYTYSTTKTRF